MDVGRKRNQILNILQEISRIEAEHPYKIPSDLDSYCKYNEEWSDCIDRVKAVIENYENYSNYDWIPADVLPEDNVDVLVWFEYYRYGEYNRLYQTHGISYVWDGQWSGFVNGTSGWKDLKIIAWMPLPEPYDKSHPLISSWNPADEPPTLNAEDAWEMARRIYLQTYQYDRAYSQVELIEIFGTDYFENILSHYSVAEAAAKIKAWEEKEK